MMRIIIGVFLSFFVVSNCYGFETGKWKVIQNSEDFLEGDLEIKKSGKNYKVPWISVYRQETPNQFPGCGIKDGKVVVKGNDLLVYDGNKLGFTIKFIGKNLKVIPNIVLNDEMCQGSQFQFLGDTQESINETIRDISNLKWKKVK